MKKIFYAFLVLFLLNIAVLSYVLFYHFDMLPKEDKYPKTVSSDKVHVYYRYNKTVIEYDGLLKIGSLADTGSMHPMMGRGNIIMKEEVKQDTKIGIGDIVTFKKDNSTIIHQVTHRNGDCFRTRGINSLIIDDGCKKKDDILEIMVMQINTYDYGVDE